MRLRESFQNMMDRVRRAAGAGESQAHAGDDLWASYKALSYENRNDFAVRLMREQLSNQKYLLYGWPIQTLYSRYATDFLPSETRLRILELGPGDNLMATALWMLEERVEKLTLLDMFKGAYMDKAAYHAPLIELVQILNHLPRSAFNNYYPFEQRSADSVEKAVHCQEDGTIALEPTRLSFVLTDDFTAFPFEDGQFNYIYSHAALEHYLDPDASIGEMNRTLEVGGLMVHQIDIRDHRFFEKDPFRYLEEPSTRWQFGSLGFPVNQWRVSQFRDAFLKNGFELLEECKVRRESDKLEGVKLAPEFAGMPPDEVVVTGVVFVLRKTADVVAAREDRQKVQWSPPQTEKPGGAGKETLRNPDFSAWADAAPEGWELWNTRVARPKPDEGMALQLVNPEKNGGLIQRASVPDLLPARLLASASVRSSSPEKVALNVYLYADPDEKKPIKTYQRSHPGDGAWHDLDVSIPLEKGVMPHHVRVVLVQRSAADETTIRGISLRHALGAEAFGLLSPDHYHVSQEYFDYVLDFVPKMSASKDQGYQQKVMNYYMGTNRKGIRIVKEVEEELGRRGLGFSGIRFLDLGSGNGGSVVGASECGAAYCEGWDINTDKLRFCRLNVETLYNDSSRIRIREMAIDAPDNSSSANEPFEVVFCQEVLEHVKDLEGAAATLARSIHLGKGVALVTVPNGFSLGSVLDDPHLQIFGITLLDRHEAGPFALALKSHGHYAAMMGEYLHYDDYMALFERHGLRCVARQGTTTGKFRKRDLAASLRAIEASKEKCLDDWRGQVDDSLLRLLQDRLSEYLDEARKRLDEASLPDAQESIRVAYMRDFGLDTLEFFVFHPSNSHFA